MRRIYFDTPCSIDGCARKVIARGLCATHYKRWQVHGDPLTVLTEKSPIGAPEAFINALPIDGDGCVVWPFACNNMGYATINRNSGTNVVSRIACEKRNGPPPTPYHQAAHECGKGHLGCVAPWHLTWKTRAENAADMVDHGTVVRGERIHCSKLTADDVRAIRLLDGAETHSAIGKRFGITQGMVSRIIRGGAWRHVI